MTYTEPHTWVYREPVKSEDLNVLSADIRDHEARAKALELLSPADTWTYVNGGTHTRVAKPRLVRYRGPVSLDANGDGRFPDLAALLGTLTGPPVVMREGAGDPFTCTLVNGTLSNNATNTVTLRFWTGTTRVAAGTYSCLILFHGTAP